MRAPAPWPKSPQHRPPSRTKGGGPYRTQSAEVAVKKLILGWRGASFSKIVLDPAVVELFGRNQVSYQIRDKHPADIRDCVERLPDDTVVITFSAAALDCFKDTPENVYIMCGGVLKSLTELFDRDWLAQFSLGDLYSHGEFDLE